MASGTDLVPLFTSSRASTGSGFQLHQAGIDVLQGAKLLTRKVALVGVHYATENSQSTEESERGLFLSPSAVSVSKQNANMLLLVLQGVSLVEESFWGSLVFILSSHVMVVTDGAISAAKIQTALPFLKAFARLQVVDKDGDTDRNASLLQELTPRLTWGAVDLKIKDMNGCDSPSTYFEQQLASGSTDTQLLLTALVPVRDCVVLKSNSFQGPDLPHTSPKLLTHAADRLKCKSLFGRYMDGALLVRLIRSLTHVMASSDGSSVALQHVVTNVVAAHWQELVQRAYKAYCDLLHAGLSVYERTPVTTEYLVDVTERKLMASHSQNNAVADAGPGEYSAFDEFGNLRTQKMSKENADGGDSMSTLPAIAPLNTGLFSFLKNRAGCAFSKQVSRLPASRWSTSARGGGQATAGNYPGSLDGNLTDVDEADLLVKSKAAGAPEQLLARCTACIVSYSVPLEYLNTPSEMMPVNTVVLNTVHVDGLDKAHAVLKPFLVDLRGPPSSFSDLACSLDSTDLWVKLARVRRRFDLANEVSSAVFCGELLRYLHSVVLRKNETDTVAQQQQQLRGRTESSIVLVDKKSVSGSAALTRVPLELLTYKNNLEAMVSQYNFVSRGPQAAKVVGGFFHGPVRSQLRYLVQQEHDRFSAACEVKEHHIEELRESLKSKERQVQRITKVNTEWSLQERKAVAEIERSHAEQKSSLEGAILGIEAQIERALADQQALYQSTMQATRRTIDTVDRVADEGRMVSGYLERYEKGHVFTSRWRQYFYVLKHATLTRYKSKSEYEERGPPLEQPISISGYSVVRSRTDELKIKLVPADAGRRLYRFRAPASVGREVWMKRFKEATHFTSR
uniref:PH domain-containing protein n=1 Tax=Hyaloperonospora arabidopsidis (strain Emoy2) TaxID=559515 RepID=M4BMR1_HYAAE